MVEQVEGGVGNLNPYQREGVLRRLYRAISNEAFMSDDREAEAERRNLMARVDSLAQRLTTEKGPQLNAEINQMLETLSGLAQHSIRRIATSNEQITEYRQRYGIPSTVRPFGYYEPQGGPGLLGGPPARTGSATLVPGGTTTAPAGGMSVEEFRDLQNQQRGKGLFGDFFNYEVRPQYRP